MAKLTVTDPTGLKSDALLPITVQPRNDSPRIISTPDTLFATDLPFIYQLEATDSDSLTFSLIDGPQGVTFDHTRHQVKWQSPVPDLYSIAFAVSDGDATSHQRFQIRVFIPNSGLRFTSQPITQTRRGQLYTYQPRVANENDFPLSFSLVTSPQRMRIDHQTGMITWIATDADLNLAKIELKVSDGGQQETQRFQVNLVERQRRTRHYFCTHGGRLDRLAIHLCAECHRCRRRQPDLLSGPRASRHPHQSPDWTGRLGTRRGRLGGSTQLN